MKKYYLLICTILLCYFTCYGENHTTGEWAWKGNGEPAMIGQTLDDHIFARNSYDDFGTTQTYDNVISFKSGDTQLVWLWLDDDQIYNTQWVQNLTPIAYNDAGDLYNEITYSSFQFLIYVPQSIELIKIENDQGDEVNYEIGTRMPKEGIILSWEKRDYTKIIDGVTYDIYAIVHSNTNAFCTHFSSRNGNLYKNNGALKKDDGALVGFYFRNKNQQVQEGRLADIIIANQEFGIRETFGLTPNYSRFFYGEGGNFETQRYQYYNRVALYGSSGMGNVIFATNISVNPTQMNLFAGSTSQLTATVLPTNASNKAVTWSTNNSQVATVNSNGRVTAVAPGTATITATTTDGTNLSASCVVTVTEDLSEYDNYLSLRDTTAFHGDTIVVPIIMDNTESIISFQTDIFLPEGLEILQEDGDYLIDPSDRMTRTHSLMSNDLSNGAIRVLCYSSNYKPFTGNSGDALFYITVKVDDYAEGDYAIQLRNTLFTTSGFEEIAAPDAIANVHVKAYLLGDANNSGTVSVTDVVVTSQYVLEMNPNPFVFEAADVNADGNITVTDVSRIAWMVLNPTFNAPLRAPALWNNGDLMSAGDISLMPGNTRTVSIALDNEMLYSAFQLDLTLPEGLTAGNFRLTDRAGSHVFNVNTLANGKTRALCYSPTLAAIRGNEGALLTFDVTATGQIDGSIRVDGIELVTTDCKSVLLDGFAINVNTATSINEISNGKAIDHVDYFNVAGQRIERPESGIILVVTTYTDGTRSTAKIIR